MCCFYMPAQWTTPCLQWAAGEKMFHLLPGLSLSQHSATKRLVVDDVSGVAREVGVPRGARVCYVHDAAVPADGSYGIERAYGAIKALKGAHNREKKRQQQQQGAGDDAASAAAAAAAPRALTIGFEMAAEETDDIDENDGVPLGIATGSIFARGLPSSGGPLKSSLMACVC